MLILFLDKHKATAQPAQPSGAQDMATISFLAGINTIFDLSGSGLGFYGPGGFGASVQVGQYQDNTYITDATGAIAGPKAYNVKWTNPASGMLSGNDQRVLRDIPNYMATLNIRLTNPTPVNTQNAQVRIFDRTNINAPASGVTCKVAELVHPWTTQAPTGSGSTAWAEPGGSGGTYTVNGVPRTYDPPLALTASPGSGGNRPSGANSADTQHDFYCIISASPDSIGSKSQFGLYFQTEYL